MLPPQFKQETTPRGTIVYKDSFPKIPLIDLRRHKPLNSPGSSTLAVTYLADGVVARQRVGNDAKIRMNSVSGQIVIEVGSVESWFNAALEASKAVKGLKGVRFEEPLGYSDYGIYFSKFYGGRTLLKTGYSASIPDRRLLNTVRGIALMHLADVYHGHLFDRNILLVGSEQEPTFVIIDPKLARKGGFESETERMGRIRHDLFPIVMLHCNALLQAGRRVERLLDKAEKTYQRENPVPVEVLGDSIRNWLLLPP